MMDNEIIENEIIVDFENSEEMQTLETTLESIELVAIKEELIQSNQALKMNNSLLLIIGILILLNWGKRNWSPS